MATSDKYDRQLRLWGAKGQKALGETTVILVRATAAGTETLKNLVLPGIGHILVVDDVKNFEGSRYSNFFSSEINDTAKSRAQVVMELLRELNPDVNGTFKHVHSLTNMDFTKLILEVKNPLVISADLEYPLLMQLSKVCAKNNVPMISVQAYGLIGSVRLQSPPVPIVEPKPDNSTPDLRLVTPFPKLAVFCEAVNLEALDDRQHGHVPYPVILYQFAQRWKKDHDRKLPSTFQEKQDFRAMIKKSARKVDLELNFIEAMNNSYLAYTERTVDRDNIQRLLHKASGKFEILLQALLIFLDSHDGAAPLHGSLPDMTASTQEYVQLQTLYRDQAIQDVKELLSNCYTHAGITEEDVGIFAQNVNTLDLIQVRSLEQEYECPPTAKIVEDLQSITWDPYEVTEHTPLLWYCGLRACHHFYSKVGRYPGTCEKSWGKDVELLQSSLVQVVNDLKLSETKLIQQTLLAPGNKFAKELARYGNAEIHTIASIVGGVASQEAVKLITSQYVPLNNTFIFNGIASVAGVYQV